MLNSIENKILDFARLTGLTGREQMTHGTLYVTLHQPERCDHFHQVIRTFYKDNINPDGGVNMYAVGDEFAFDFVPSDREAPVFADEDKGIWSEFAEEGLTQDFGIDSINLSEQEEAEAEVMMDLQNDAIEGR